MRVWWRRRRRKDGDEYTGRAATSSASSSASLPPSIALAPTDPTTLALAAAKAGFDHLFANDIALALLAFSLPSPRRLALPPPETRRLRVPRGCAGDGEQAACRERGARRMLRARQGRRMLLAVTIARKAMEGADSRRGWNMRFYRRTRWCCLGLCMRFQTPTWATSNACTPSTPPIQSSRNSIRQCSPPVSTRISLPCLARPSRPSH
ncbi:hypothetical protein B0H19DRAFT_712969 [Mycena capillaripes]|nr:hypothetical protein B0H19DRAFT_712969 [Mycena capillaripes]